MKTKHMVNGWTRWVFVFILLVMIVTSVIMMSIIYIGKIFKSIFSTFRDRDYKKSLDRSSTDQGVSKWTWLLIVLLLPIILPVVLLISVIGLLLIVLSIGFNSLKAFKHEETIS